MHSASKNGPSVEANRNNGSVFRDIEAQVDARYLISSTQSSTVVISGQQVDDEKPLHLAKQTHRITLSELELLAQTSG